MVKYNIKIVEKKYKYWEEQRQQKNIDTEKNIYIDSGKNIQWKKQ